MFNLDDFSPREQIRKIGQGLGQSLINMGTQIIKDWKNIIEEGFIPIIRRSENLILSWCEEDDNFVDKLGRNFLLKIKAHQDGSKSPKPNLFCVGGNIIADKTTKIIKKCNDDWKEELPRPYDLEMKIPPFSNDFTFMIKGLAADKGGASIFKDKANTELISRAELRKKQGTIFRFHQDIGLKLHEWSEKSL
jgi:hypothetical protein